MTTEFMEFDLDPLKPVGRKTDRWNVINKHSRVLLGYVAWQTHWRRYTFVPEPHTCYDAGCLHEIAQFCDLETKKRKTKK